LTQAELAERAGIQRATVNRIETGVTAARFATVRKLAAALGVPADVLLAADDATGVTSGPASAATSGEGKGR